LTNDDIRLIEKFEDWPKFQKELSGNYLELKHAFNQHIKANTALSFSEQLQTFISYRYRKIESITVVPEVSIDSAFVTPQASNIKNSWDLSDMSDQIKNYIKPTIAYKGEKKVYMTRPNNNQNIPKYASAEINTGKFRNPMRKYFSRINDDPFDLNRFI